MRKPRLVVFGATAAVLLVGGIAASAASAADSPSGPAAPQVTSAPKAAQPVSVVAASQRAVTAASISSSPTSPVQREMLALINANRRRGGCGPLTTDRRLVNAANGHAYEMARYSYFGHESRDGEGSGDRMTDAGYDWSRYGENIARGQTSVYQVVDGWMHSPVHRENIMDCRLDQMGIGLAFAGRRPYWVQDFATPEK